VDKDGINDFIIATSNQGPSVAWYRRSISGWTKYIIDSAPLSIEDVADMDGDGDLDVIIGEHNLKDPASAKLYVFENVDGKGNVWLSHVVSIGDEHHDGAVLVDIDGDGDLDIISIGWGHSHVLLYENKAIDRRR
jgi:FG-GAP-like repeat